jgi:hypothetical protein
LQPGGHGSDAEIGGRIAGASCLTSPFPSSVFCNASLCEARGSDTNADFALAQPAGQRLQKMMRLGQRLYRLGRFVMISLPAFLLACALVLPWIPGATGLFSDSAGPWYQPITSPLFLAALFYSYPVTLFCTRLGGDDMFFSPGYYVVLAIYSLIWVLLLRALFSLFERRHAMKS